MAVEIRLPRNQFRNIIRVINKSGIDLSSSIRQITYDALKRLGVKRDLTKAKSGIPRGSDQVDLGSIKTWLSKIQVSNVDAIKQLVVIDATAVVRTKG